MDSNLILFRKGRKKLCRKRNVDIYNRIFEESKSEKLLLFLRYLRENMFEKIQHYSKEYFDDRI